MVDTLLDAERLRAQVEIEITKQALELFKSLRQEYSDMNERLQRRVDELEKQRADSIKRLDDLSISLKAAQKKEKDYQSTIARLTREVEDLRREIISLRNENVALSRLVEELRNEIDGFRADMRGD